jgi:predicted MFS family arabinose efflux permease
MSQMQYALERVAREPRVGLSRRVAFAAVAYALAAAMLGTTLPTPLYGLYRDRFGFSELTVTVVFATYAAGVIGALLVAGRLSDAIGRRRVLLPGLLLSAASAVVFLLAGSLAMLLVGRVLSGLSAGIFTGTATATLVDLAPLERRGRATLVAATANMVGLSLGPLFAGVLSEFAGSPLRLSFWLDLALLAPAVALVWLMPEPLAPAGGLRLQLRRPGVPVEVRGVFLRAALAAFAGFAVLGLYSAVIPGFLSEHLGIDDRAAIGAVAAAVFAASAVGQTLLAPLFRSQALAAGSGALLAGTGLLALALGLSSPALLLAAGLVAGLGHGLSFRAGLAAINEGSSPAHRAEAASSFFLVAYVAISLPVVGVGVLASAAGLVPAGIVFALAVGAVAASALAIDTQRKEHAR